MVSFPFKESDLAAEANDAAVALQSAEARWTYCLKRTSFKFIDREGYEHTTLNSRTFPVCDRITGCRPGGSAMRLRWLSDLGWEGAQELAAGFRRGAGRPMFDVGPLQPWMLGHVYLARVHTHPHVVKIGFSRRARHRLEDIESKCVTKLFVKPDELFVGTLADEHWWHRTYAANRIAGEWFIDANTRDVELPHFLTAEREAA